MNVTAAIPSPPEPARNSPLDAEHRSHGGHMVPFAGYNLPLYYEPTGILAEHKAVREGVGVFDVSHMGVLTLEGEGAAELLSRRTPTNVPKMAPGACRYSAFMTLDGVMFDDLLITRLDDRPEPTSFLVIPNAATASRVHEILLQHRPRLVTQERWNGRTALLAVQGPRSRDVLEQLFGWDLGPLKFYTGGFFPWEGSARARHFGPARLGGDAFISRTGYTGELGYEVLVDAPRAPAVWTALVKAGVTPCGLGARDTLRLEKGYLLSGTDFHMDRTPLEAGLDRFIAFDHPFVGRAALEAQKAKGTYARWTGIKVDDATVIPRHGTVISSQGNRVAVATSGGRSPTLGQGIALTYLPPELTAPGTVLDIDVRGHTATARVVPLPFVPAAKPPA